MVEFHTNVTDPIRVILVAAAIARVGTALFTATVTLGVVGGAFYLLFKRVNFVSWIFLGNSGTGNAIYFWDVNS